MKTHKSLADEALIELYVSGNNDAFNTLLLRHKSRVFTYIHCNIRDKDVANDIFQDTFMKVIVTLKQGRYNENGKFLAWVMRIAHNLIADYFRREQNENTISNEFAGYDLLNNAKLSDPSIEDDMVKTQVMKDVSSLINSLPRIQREAIQMRYYENMSFKEIAEKTGVSINTALGRMRYAVQNMRRLAEENNMQLTY